MSGDSGKLFCTRLPNAGMNRALAARALVDAARYRQVNAMPRFALPLIALSFLGCADETVSGYADPKATYRLVEIEGEAFTARATITFPEEGRIAGEAPCNRWNAEQRVPYPWFEAGPIAATRRACPELEAEARFLTMLSEMTLAEVQGPVLILSDDGGRAMVFEAK